MFFFMSQNKYEKRGVSSQKEDVHKAIKNIDKGLFKNVFCKILPDIFNNSDNALVLHADGAGTKSSLAYLYWKETNDISVWRGIAQDALFMNVDDMLCVGALGPLLISSTIGRNKKLIPGEIIATIIDEFNEQAKWLSSIGINSALAGGETADVGDLVKTIIVDSTVYTSLKKDDVILIDIQPGNVIVGFASYGKASYEKEYNSGIGSNGLTFARHEVLHHIYAEKYPETYDSLLEKEYIYSGKYLLNELENETQISIGKLLLSPTRTYAPLMKEILPRFKNDIKGIIHCTGGGQTKVLHFTKNVHIIKNNMLPLPPIFKLIQSVSNCSWSEMYSIFNMGHRLEIYTNEKTAYQLIQIAKSFKVEANIIGYVEKSNKNELTIKCDKENLYYKKD